MTGTIAAHKARIAELENQLAAFSAIEPAGVVKPLDKARWAGDATILPRDAEVVIIAADLGDPDTQKACWIRFWPENRSYPAYRSCNLSDLDIHEDVSARIMSAIEPAGVGVETDDQASLRNDLHTAIGIGPRVGSMSLLSAMKNRAAGRTIQSIADEAGVTKGAMNQALKKGASRLAALNGDKQ